MKKIMKQKFGFTLVELLIFMGLMSIMLLLLMQVFVTILNSQTEAEATSNVVQDGRYILAKLAYDINRAKAITVPSAIGTTTNLGTDPQLQLTITEGGIDRPFSYYVSNGQLILSNYLGNNVLNGPYSQTTALTFTRIGNISGQNTIQIKLTTSGLIQKQAGLPEVESFQTTVGIR